MSKKTLVEKLYNIALKPFGNYRVLSSDKCEIEGVLHTSKSNIVSGEKYLPHPFTSFIIDLQQSSIPREDKYVGMIFNTHSEELKRVINNIVRNNSVLMGIVEDGKVWIPSESLEYKTLNVTDIKMLKNFLSAIGILITDCYEISILAISVSIPALYINTDDRILMVPGTSNKIPFADYRSLKNYLRDFLNAEHQLGSIVKHQVLERLYYVNCIRNLIPLQIRDKWNGVIYKPFDSDVNRSCLLTCDTLIVLTTEDYNQSLKLNSEYNLSTQVIQANLLAVNQDSGDSSFDDFSFIIY